MANNDYLEALLEESIRAQNRTNYAVQGVAAILIGLPATSAYIVLAFLEDASDYTSTFLLNLFITGAVVIGLIFLGVVLYLFRKARIIPQPQNTDGGVTRNGSADKRSGQGYSVPAAVVKTELPARPRPEPYSSKTSRRATEKDLNIAKYFSTDEYTAWQLAGRPSLEAWVDAGRPELLKWLEENSEN